MAQTLMAPTAQTYVLALPWSKPPLTDNMRFVHWSQRNRLVSEVRTTVAWLAKAAKIPQCSHLTVQLIWAPGDRRRRDAGNLHLTLKSAIDALARGRDAYIGLNLVPDDCDKYVTELPCKIEPPPHPKGMWLIVKVT